jgi:hypothetical protein
MLGQLARALADAVNEPAGAGPEPAAAGRHFGQKLFDFDRSTQGLQGLPANTNAVMGEVSVEITHAGELKGREYELRIDGTDPSKGQLVRVPDDGTVINVDDGVEVPGEGFVIHFDSGIIPGDRYRLQPTALAAMGMRVNISNPADLAAASPLVGAAGSANTGTLTVDALRMQSLPVDPTATTTITGAATAAGTPYDLDDGGHQRHDHRHRHLDTGPADPVAARRRHQRLPARPGRRAPHRRHPQAGPAHPRQHQQRQCAGAAAPGHAAPGRA